MCGMLDRLSARYLPTSLLPSTLPSTTSSTYLYTTSNRVCSFPTVASKPSISPVGLHLHFVEFRAHWFPPEDQLGADVSSDGHVFVVEPCVHGEVHRVVAFALVELLDQGVAPRDTRTGGIPSDDHLVGVHALVELEHGTVEIDVHGHLEVRHRPTGWSAHGSPASRAFVSVRLPRSILPFPSLRIARAFGSSSCPTCSSLSLCGTA
eukprot:scaffold1054_cov333-Pavlova_lutheri.AAC.3